MEELQVAACSIKMARYYCQNHVLINKIDVKYWIVLTRIILPQLQWFKKKQPKFMETEKQSEIT